MKRNIFKLLFTLIIVVFAFTLSSCEEEEVDHVKVVTLQRHEDEYKIGQFNYESYSFMVQYDDGTKKEVFLTEDMLSDYDKMVVLQEGKHTITANVLGKKVEFTVEATSKEILDVSFTSVQGVYNGKEYTIEVTGKIPAGAKIEYFPKNKFVQAGIYDVEAVISCDNYITKHMNAQVVIEKATYDLSSFTFEDYTTTYNGDVQKLEIKGTMPEGLTYYYTFSTKPTPQDTDIKGNSATQAGTYYVTLHISGDKANYKTDNLTITKTLTINKQEIVFDTKEVSMKDMIVEYDGKYHSITLNEDKLPHNVSVEYINNNQINAGEYQVKAVFSLTDTVNYKIINSLTATLTIQKASYDMSGITMDDVAFDYDGESHAISYSGTLPRGVELAYYENNNQYKAGEYQVTAYFKIADSNHNAITPITGKLTINKAKFVSTDLSLDGGEFTYDGNYHEAKLIGDLPAGVQVVYKAWNDKATDLGSITKFKDVGAYTVVASFKFEKENYEEYVDIADVTTTVTIKIREFDDENQNIQDLTFTYDGTNHGTSEGINLPSWATMKSFTLLDSKGVPIDEAVNAGNYFYYYTYEYFNGVETIIDNTRTAAITINKLRVEYGVNFSLSNVTKEYDGNAYDPTIHFVDVPDEEVLINSVNVLITDSNGDGVINAIDADDYTVKYTFVDTMNYVFSTGYANITLKIEKQIIEVDGANFAVQEVEVDYDGETHYPNVLAKPEHTIVEFTKMYGNYYKVKLKPENDNYTVTGYSEVTASVVVNSVKLKYSNSGIEVMSNGETLSSTTSVYTTRGYKNIEAANFDLDTVYNNAELRTFNMNANGENVNITSLFAKNFEKLNDKINLSNCKLVYVRDDNTVFEMAEFSSLSELKQYYLHIATDNFVNFDTSKGTPYGTYLLYYTLGSIDSMVTVETASVVTEIKVNKQTFDAASYFTPQSVLWVDDTNNPTPYFYDLNKLGDLPEGVVIDTKSSVFYRNYNDGSALLIKYSLNLNIYGVDSGSYAPTMIIQDKTVDISKMSIRYSTIIYDAENHQYNWSDPSKIVNMTQELSELIENGVVNLVFDTKDGTPAVTPGSYEVKVALVSNNSHLIVLNSSLTGNEAVISSVLIIQKKMVTEDQIEQAAKQAVIVRDNGVAEDNVSVTVDYVEKEDKYQKTIVYTGTLYNEYINNAIRFTRGDLSQRYLTPVAGMQLVGVDYTNEKGSIIYSTGNDINIRKSNNQNQYLEKLNTPILREYYVLHYQLDDYTSLTTTDVTTYDLYIRVDSVALYIKEENVNVSYSGTPKTLTIENQNEISKLVNFKYVDQYGNTSAYPDVYTEIGSHYVGIEVYCYDENANNVYIGSVARTFTINKIVIDNNYYDTYIIKTLDWTGKPIGIFNTLPGWSLPEHVVLKEVHVDGVMVTQVDNYTDPCTHTIKFVLDIDDSGDYKDHYELAEDQKEYEYTFTIRKAQVEANLMLGDSVVSFDEENKYVYSNDTNALNFKINSTFDSDIASVSYRYCLANGSLQGIAYQNDTIALPGFGKYKVQVKLNIAENYKDKVDIGRYVNGVFTKYVFDSEMCIVYDNVIVVDKIDLDKINMEFENQEIEGIHEGKIYNANDGTYINIIYGDVSVQYQNDGYVFSFDSEENYFEIVNYILINRVLGSYDGASISDDSITIIGVNTFKLNNANLVPGDYYIAFAYNTTIAEANGYYYDSAYDTYLGIHLTIN